MTVNRLRDYVLYVAVGLCFGCACVWRAYHDVDFRWIVLVFETCLVFGYTIARLRRLWRQSLFWVTLGFLFAIHSTVFGIAFRQVPRWRAPVVGFVFVMEIVAATPLFKVAITCLEARRRRRRIIRQS